MGYARATVSGIVKCLLTKFPTAIVAFPTPFKGLKNSFQKKAMKWKFKRKQKEARVHFIPT
jgi:hypothetical protein